MAIFYHFFYLCLIFLWCGRCLNSSTLTVEIVTLGNIYPNVPGAIPFTGPGIETAVEELQRTYQASFNFSHTFVFDRRYPNCVELATGSDDFLSRWYYDPNRNPKMVTAFIFGGCLETYPTNRLVAGWNSLMITSVTNGKILRDKTLSPTWITGSCVSLINYLKLFSNLLGMFNWTSIYLIGDSNANPVYLDMFPSLAQLISKINKNQLTQTFIDSTRPVDFGYFLKEFQAISRVLIFLGHGKPLRQLMLAAAELSMVNGDYVYLAVEVFENPMFDSFTWKYGDGKDDQAKEAFRSVLLLGPDRSIYDAPSDDLVNEWKRRSLVKFNVSYSQLNPYVMASYSSVMMFGKVLNDTLTANPSFNFSDGKELTKRFLNQTFKLNYTEMYIDEVGERRTNLVVRDLNTTSGLFTTILLQDKARSNLRKVAEIDWGPKDGTPPLNEPVCGYAGNRRSCNQTSNINATLIGMIIAVCILLAIGFFSYFQFSHRHYRQEKWWKINAEILHRTDLHTFYV